MLFKGTMGLVWVGVAVYAAVKILHTVICLDDAKLAVVFHDTLQK